MDDDLRRRFDERMQGHLWSAIKRDDVRRVAKLLRDGAHAGLRDSDGATPLIEAARKGRRRCFDLLLGMCDCDAHDARGWTAMDWAMSHKNVDFMERLVEVADVRALAPASLAALVPEFAGLPLWRRLAMARAKESSARWTVATDAAFDCLMLRMASLAEREEMDGELPVHVEDGARQIAMAKPRL